MSLGLNRSYLIAYIFSFILLNLFIILFDLINIPFLFELKKYYIITYNIILLDSFIIFISLINIIFPLRGILSFLNLL